MFSRDIGQVTFPLVVTACLTSLLLIYWRFVLLIDLIRSRGTFTAPYLLVVAPRCWLTWYDLRASIHCYIICLWLAISQRPEVTASLPSNTLHWTNCSFTITWSASVLLHSNALAATVSLKNVGVGGAQPKTDLMYVVFWGLQRRLFKGTWSLEGTKVFCYTKDWSTSSRWRSRVRAKVISTHGILAVQNRK